MITTFAALILGIVEGFTEFLPISSTAHLILTSHLLGLSQSSFVKTFEIAIQSGAMLAVVAVYWRKFLDFEIIKRITAAFIPTAIIGFFLYKIAKEYLLDNLSVVLWALALGGILLILFERFYRVTERTNDIREISYGRLIAIGIAQALAIIPGISRSGATIIGGLFLGLSRAAIVEFSFLLAVPTIFAATALDVFKNWETVSSADMSSLSIGFIASFITALISIKFLLAFVRKHSFVSFGIYRIALVLVFILFFLPTSGKTSETATTSNTTIPVNTEATSREIPTSKILSTNYHIFQTFNNCAPAALSMALSYYGIDKSQELLASELRPYNNRTGNNDDKSTPPDELAAKGQELGLIPYFRPAGNIETIKKLIAADTPVVVRTLLYPDKDFAHYRVVKGYDDKTKEIIQDDSLEGKNLRFSYEEFLHLWKPFNYAYLVFATDDNKKEIEKILGENLDSQTAWENARAIAETELRRNPSNTASRFNLAVAHYYLGDNKGTAREFEAVEPKLGEHTIWYQIEPIQAYFNLSRYDRVIELTDSILNNNNKAFTELYLLKGEVYRQEGKLVEARAEFEKALYYNKNSKQAQAALESLR